MLVARGGGMMGAAEGGCKYPNRFLVWNSAPLIQRWYLDSREPLLRRKTQSCFRFNMTRNHHGDAAARGVGPPKRKSIQNCNILQVHGTMQKCNSLIFDGLVRAPLAPQKFCIICYNFTLWEGLFFGGPWVCARAKKMRNLQFPNVGYSYSMTKPLKHKFDSK